MTELLTPRQVEVMEQVITGASNREIGAKLFIAEDTVKDQLLKINRRTPSTIGSSRTAIAVWYIREYKCGPMCAWK